MLCGQIETKANVPILGVSLLRAARLDYDVAGNLVGIDIDNASTQGANGHARREQAARHG